MSDVSQTAALAAILDALTLMQDQVEEIGERSKRLEANQADILARLETIDAAQAIATDLQPNLEHLASEVSETRGEMGEGFARVAQVAGWAHAAAAGNAAPLPADEDLRDPGAPGLAMGGRDAVDLRDQIVLEPKTDHHFQSPVQRCHRANVLHWCQMAYPAIPHN